MGIRLVATDVDGTLLTPERTLSPRTLRAIADAQRAGVRVCACSGRNYTEVKALCKRARLDDWTVINNGACVVNHQTGEARFAQRLNPNKAEALLLALCEDARRHGNAVICVAGTSDNHNPLEFCDAQMTARAKIVSAESGFTNERYYLYEDIGEWIRACAPDLQRILYGLDVNVHGRRVQQLLAPIEAVDITQGVPGKLEIVPKGVDKGTGMEHLCELYGVDPSECMAIGDGVNDIDMLQKAGLGVAMKNSVQSVFEYADETTESNEDDGFAQALYRYVLNRG